MDPNFSDLDYLIKFCLWTASLGLQSDSEEPGVLFVHVVYPSYETGLADRLLLPPWTLTGCPVTGPHMFTPQGPSLSAFPVLLGSGSGSL